MAVLWVGPDWYWYLLIGTRDAYHKAAAPWQTLTALSLQCYALLTFFILGSWIATRGGGTPEGDFTERRAPLAAPACSAH
jgi:hypothetical protein